MVKIVVETKNSKLMLKLNCCEVHFVRIRGVHNDDTRKRTTDGHTLLNRWEGAPKTLPLVIVNRTMYPPYYKT